MDVCAAFVPHLEPAETIEPRQGPFSHPPKPSQSLARIDTAPRNTRNDSSSTKRLMAPLEVRALVGMQLRGALARASSPPARQPERENGIQCRLSQRLRVCYQLARNHQSAAAYLLAKRMLALHPKLAPLFARTALLLAQEDVPLEGLDLLEKLLSLGCRQSPLVRAYARILGRLGYHREALIALRTLWNTAENA